MSQFSLQPPSSISPQCGALRHLCVSCLPGSPGRTEYNWLRLLPCHWPLNHLQPQEVVINNSTPSLAPHSIHLLHQLHLHHQLHPLHLLHLSHLLRHLSHTTGCIGSCSSTTTKPASCCQQPSFTIHLLRCTALYSLSPYPFNTYVASSSSI